MERREMLEQTTSIMARVTMRFDFDPSQGDTKTKNCEDF
jgi:hypothetical protein